MLTVSEIKQILRAEHISISKCRGQNFLVDSQVQKRIIDAIGISSTEGIIEIGPGLGALTEDLAKQANKVVAVEKDKGLVKVLEKRLLKYANLTIIHQDILKVDLSGLIKRQTKLVGNLPFYITTPIISLLLEARVKALSDIFITVQREVGKRLVAKKNSKDYSSLSVFAQYFTYPQILFAIPKKAFYPQPRVDSLFMHLRLLKEPPVSVKSEEQFFKIVRRAFAQRRKTIVNSLSANLSRAEKANIRDVLESQGLNLRARAENLGLYNFSAIENAFYKRRIKF